MKYLSYCHNTMRLFYVFKKLFLKLDDKITFKGFNIYNHIHTDCQRPSGGSSIFVKSSCPQRNIQLTTELQATAVSVTLDKEITIYSIYIPPSFSLKTEHLEIFIKTTSFSISTIR